MTKSSKFVIVAISIIALLSIAATYYKYFVLLDYTIQVEIDCDPQEERCFIYNCDPLTEECTGDPENDIWYYKILHRKAYNMPLCNTSDSEECSTLSCPKGELGCYEELCEISSENQCSSPSKKEDEDMEIEESEEIFFEDENVASSSDEISDNELQIQ